MVVPSKESRALPREAPQRASITPRFSPDEPMTSPAFASDETMTSMVARSLEMSVCPWTSRGGVRRALCFSGVDGHLAISVLRPDAFGGLRRP